jgi:3-hydroxyacyl-[acyl-carrier-protein] dehydratase
MMIPLALGPDVVQRIIPHRRPFVMVDLIEAYARAPVPTLHASRLISSNEAVFEGHFPGLQLWPGVYTIEGMGQACNLLQVIASMEEQWVGQGGAADAVLAALRNLELGYRLSPGYRPEATAQLEAYFARSAMTRAGFSAAVEVKLLAPVFAGQRLDYRVSRSKVLESLARFEVEAHVGGKCVAKGVMTSSLEVPVLPGAL